MTRDAPAGGRTVAIRHRAGNMILIAMPSCPGLGLVILARSMRRTSAALSVCWARSRGHGVLLSRTRCHQRFSSPGTHQTRLPSATGRTAAFYARRPVAALPARSRAGLWDASSYLRL